jgi:Domain of unknown function (DUF4157)/A nuclease family of the HNH/ENDO VII superfamily with conserved AHH
MNDRASPVHRDEKESRRRRSSARSDVDSFAGPSPRDLQDALGNRGLLSLLRSGTLQAKLEVSEPHDPLEREADAVSDAVLRAPPSPASSVSPPPAGTLGPGRTTSPESGEAAVGSILGGDAGGPGQPLDPNARSFFEARFGYDFSGVRIHAGRGAARAARAISARAFTVGNDIAFAEGSYDSATAAGRKLLAHELTHVVQRSWIPDGGVVHRQDSSGAEGHSGVSDADNRNAERALVDAALASRDSDDVQKIIDFTVATVDERLELTRIVLDQGWVGPMDEYAIEAIWATFSVDTISNNMDLMQQCIDRGAELDDLPQLRTLREDFEADVKALAHDHMQMNREVTVEEMNALGINPDGALREETTEEENTRLGELQSATQDVVELQQAQADLGTIPVGYQLLSHNFIDGVDHPTFALAYFSPGGPPQMDEEGRGAIAAGESYMDFTVPPEQLAAKKPAAWSDVKDQYDAATLVITGYANSNPAIQQALAGESGDVAKLATGRPDDVRRAVATSLSALLAKIDDTSTKIDDLYLELQPIHAQLFAGAGSASGTDWSQALPKFVGQDVVKDYESAEFWKNLGLGTLAAAAFIFAEFATGGMATFLLAAGTFTSGFVAGQSWRKALDLSEASQASTSPELAIVSQEQATSAQLQAVLNTMLAFIDLAAAGQAAKGGVKTVARALEEVGEEAAHAAAPVVRRGPEAAANFAELEERFVGKKLADVGAPPGYTTFERDGSTFLRRTTADETRFARLTVDSEGFVRFGRAESARLSSPAKMVKALRDIPEGFQRHHIVPDEIVRKNPLFQEARTRGVPPYDLDAAENLIGLPNSAKAADAAGAAELPLHSGSHPTYSRLANDEANAALNDLIELYGSVDKIPGEQLTSAARNVEAAMRDEILTWKVTHGGKLN